MVKKILIVDDDPDIIYTIKKRFEVIDKNYQILGANSGKKCLELLTNNKIPDLILLDVMMPELSGWEVAAELKKNPKWKEIPIIFLTAKTDSYSKTFGGIVAEDYITKPFEFIRLKESIDKLLCKKD